MILNNLNPHCFIAWSHLTFDLCLTPFPGVHQHRICQHGDQQSGWHPGDQVQVGGAWADLHWEVEHWQHSGHRDHSGGPGQDQVFFRSGCNVLNSVFFNQQLLEGGYKPRSNPITGMLIGEDGIMVMTGAESLEWYQMHQTGVWCHSICPVPDIIMSRPPLSSLHWFLSMVVNCTADMGRKL